MMQKKISVISGGSSGLGLELAELLVKSGRNTIILGRSIDRLSDAINRLTRVAKNCFIEFYRCNIGIESEVKELGEYIVRNNYLVEYLFNNAGRGLFRKATETTSELIDKVFEPNLKGLILLTTEILRITPPEEELNIINIMSTSALLGRAEESVYCAAKWGARGYTEALRTELKGTRRNIIAVYPGGMRTNFWNVTEHNRQISGFMDPADVAKRIVNAVLDPAKLVVTDLTISRKS